MLFLALAAIDFRHQLRNIPNRSEFYFFGRSKRKESFREPVSNKAKHSESIKLALRTPYASQQQL